MNDQISKTQPLKCTTCSHPTPQLYKKYPKTNIITLQTCQKCHKDVDPYIEYSVIIKLLDVLLLQNGVFVHFFYNTDVVRRINGRSVRLLLISLIVKTFCELPMMYESGKSLVNDGSGSKNQFSNLTNTKITPETTISVVITQNLQNEIYKLIFLNFSQLLFFTFISSLLLLDFKKLPKVIFSSYSVQILKVLISIYVYKEVKWFYIFSLDMLFLQIVTTFYFAISRCGPGDFEDHEKSVSKMRVKFSILFSGFLAYFLKENFEFL